MKTKLAVILLFFIAFFPAQIFSQTAAPNLNEQMWEAARAGDTALVASLLDKGADVNAKFRYGTTALFKAAERGHVDVVKLLLARGADVTVRDTFYGATAMTWALDNKHIGVIQAILDKDPTSVTEVLMTGVNENNPELAQTALDKGGLKPETLTAALVAAQQNKEAAAIAEMLKKAGAVPPMQIEPAILNSYAGTYRMSDGSELVLRANEGNLVANFGGRPFPLIALEKTIFRPVAFEGLTLTFNFDGEKVKSVTIKQPNSTSEFMRVADPAKP